MLNHTLMKGKRLDSLVKYLYDLSKGVLLLTVVSPWVSGQSSWLLILMGSLWACSLYLWAFWLEGDQA